MPSKIQLIISVTTTRRNGLLQTRDSWDSPHEKITAFPNTVPNTSQEHACPLNLTYSRTPCHLQYLLSSQSTIQAAIPCFETYNSRTFLRATHHPVDIDLSKIRNTIKWSYQIQLHFIHINMKKWYALSLSCSNETHDSRQRIDTLRSSYDFHRS